MKKKVITFIKNNGIFAKYNDSQPRDDHGRWAGGSETSEGLATKIADKFSQAAEASGAREDHHLAAKAHALAAHAHEREASLKSKSDYLNITPGSNKEAEYHNAMASGHYKREMYHTVMSLK